jgi:peptidylprolyl isomerase
MKLLIAFLVLHLSLVTFAKSKHHKKRIPASPLSQTSESASLQRILDIENQRKAQDPFLLTSLKSPSSRVVKSALMALGRIGDPDFGTKEISDLLNGKSQENKIVAAFALSLIGSESSRRVLNQHASIQSDNIVIAALVEAMGRGGDESTLTQLLPFLRDKNDPKVIESAVKAIGLLWAKGVKTEGGALAQLGKYLNTPAAFSAAFAMSRYKEDPAQLPLKELLAALPNAPSDTKLFIIRTLGKIKSLQVTQELVKDLVSKSKNEPPLKIEMAKALSNQEPQPIILDVLLALTLDKNIAVAVSAWDSMATPAMKVPNYSDKILAAYQKIPLTSPWAKSAALKAVSKIQFAAVSAEARNFIKMKTSDILRAGAAYSLGTVNEAQDAELISQILLDDEPLIVESLMEGLSSLPESSFDANLKTALRKSLERADLGITAAISELALKMVWKDFAQSLALVYPLFNQRDAAETKVSILTALQTLGDSSHVSTVESAFKDPEKTVVEAAVKAYKGITGKDAAIKIPLNSTASLPTPEWSELKEATKKSVKITTNRGDFIFQMMDAAPMTAYHFINLVKKEDFYKNKPFHRLVPNFVIQGGDPRGDGYGGPGFFIRDEVSPVSHTKGTVGIATSGKDTGGSQFFVNLSTNPHLDGRYTVFAKVTQGLNTVESLELGDRILSIKLLR